ncbi:MAG: hypothetical protein KC593_24845 [Myxococcales bacterium]|nr:hypothetical protein [Myxococcales bacterium]MCB9625984.1 hypothetical protein [Sandaracinaceae bacterium]
MTASPVSQGPYVLHEWGLVVSELGRQSARAITTARGAGGAGLLGVFGDPVQPIGVGLGRSFGVGAGGKPVLYFHLDEGTASLSLSVAVQPAGGGRVLEHFPPGTLGAGATALSWPNVRVTRGVCRGTYPQLTDPGCRTEDALCELAELSAYETADADCVHVGDAEAGLLFYRTGPAEAELPLSVERASDMTVRVRARPGAAPVRGFLMRIERGATLLDTFVRLARMDELGADGIEIPRAIGEGVVAGNEGRALLQDSLDSAGLTRAERDAFMLAWGDALFGVVTRGGGIGEPDDGSLTGRGVGRGAAARGVGVAPRLGSIGGSPPVPRHPLGSVQDALLYVLPQASVDDLLPLTLDPRPRDVRRVFVARVDLSTLGNAPLRAAAPEVQGALDPQVVRRVIRRHFGALRRCLLPHDAALAFQLGLRVLTTGAVSEVTVDGELLSDEERSCVLGVARGFTFPAAETVSTIRQPMTVPY